MVLVLVLVVEGLVSPRFFFFFTGAVFVEETDRKKERHWEKGKRSPTISPTALTPTESDLQAGRRKSRPICSAELFAFLSLSLSHQARFECVSLVFLSISYVFFSVDFFLLCFFFFPFCFLSSVAWPRKQTTTRRRNIERKYLMEKIHHSCIVLLSLSSIPFLMVGI